MWKAHYYTGSDGSCEIADFLDGLKENNRQKVLAWVTMLEEEGPTLPRPFADLLEDGIHELRIKLSGNQTRILYFFVYQRHIILTHSFSKKASAVPRWEINKAKRIRDEFKQRYRTPGELGKSTGEGD